MKITHPNGKEIEIEILKMSAIEGWDMQRKFIEFAMSKDSAFRTAYTMEVLSFAEVKIGNDQKIPLKTSALIENHLGNWSNLRDVFESVLMENDIDPKTHAEREDYWTKAGAEMAASFLGEAMKLLAPFIGGESPKKE